MRKSIIVWVASVLAAAGISAVITAQAQSGNTAVVSGADFGFRVEGQRREQRLDTLTGRRSPVDVVTGQLVVKIDGQWVEAEIAGGGFRPATQ